MIELTRLNGTGFIVNCDLIRYAEAAPDTILTLVTGEKLVVRESCAELSQRVREHRAALLRTAWPDAASHLAVRGVSDALDALRSSESTDAAHTN